MSTPVEQVKDRLNIVDVISSYIKVEKAGVNFKARCPFHNEKTPSFFISSSRQTFYCFGCQEKGDVFSFVEKFEGVDFKTALENLADRAGVELKKFKREDTDKSEDVKDRLFKITEEASRIFEENLENNNNAKDYLLKRGLSEQGIKNWRIGYAKDEWRSLYDKLLQKGYSNNEMLEAGLIKKVAGDTSTGRGQDKYYDTFRDRITFPIGDSNGKVIAFSGRTLKKDDLPGQANKTPKYLNSPETKLFYKSEVLYGWHIAKTHIRKLDYAVLVEGQMDLIMSHEAGVPNTVASSGTALTLLHLKKIQKITNRIIIAYDSDPAGEKASQRASILALSLGMEVKIAVLPKGEDPASIAKENKEKWKETLRRSIHLLDFALEKAFRDKGDKERDLTREVVKNVLPLLTLLKSDIEKSQFIKKIAMRLRVPEHSVLTDLSKVKAPEVSEMEKYEFVENQKSESRGMSLERIMAGWVFLDEVSGVKKNIRKVWQDISSVKEVDSLMEAYDAEKEVLIFEAERFAGDNQKEEVIQDILKRIEQAELKKKLQKIAFILDDKSVSGEEEAEARKQFETIEKRLREIST